MSVDRQYKKLTKRAKDLLITASMAQPDEFYLFGGEWKLETFCQSREESWHDEIDPWKYLYGLAQETCVKYIEVETDDELGWTMQEVLIRPFDLTTIEAINIFKKHYIKALS